jgi:hypothetical protein
MQRCHIFPFATTAICTIAKNAKVLLRSSSIQTLEVSVYFFNNSRLVAGMAFVVIVVAGVGVGVGVVMVVVVVLVAVVVMPMAVPKAMVLVTILVVF